MSSRLDHSSIEELNLALRHYRRLPLRLLIILVLGFAAAFGLGRLGTWLSPPYGVYVFGEDLATYGSIAVLALAFAELWWEGRRIGRALNDPVPPASPVSGSMSGLGVVARRADAMGMTWSGFFGPLKPVRGRRPEPARRRLAGVRAARWRGRPPEASP